MKKLKIFLASIVVSFMFALTGCDFSISSKEYAVDFIIDNEVSSTAKVEEGSKVSAPENPSKVGYEFLGWYNGETEFDFNSEVKSEIDLVAKFEAIQYDLILNLDGGEIEGNFPLSSKYTVEDTVTLPTPTKVDYIFVGWKESENANVLASAQLTNMTGNKNYSAIWAKIEDLEMNVSVPLYIDNTLYKVSNAKLLNNVLETVDNLDETTAGWFKDENLNNPVLSTDVIVSGMKLYTKQYSSSEDVVFLDSNGDFGISPKDSWNGVIPRKVDGKIVDRISYIWTNRSEKYNIVLPSGIIAVPKFFLEVGDSLVNLPNTVTTIGNVNVKVKDMAIEISKNNSIIESYTFYGMNLVGVTFESNSKLNTIEENAFEKTTLTEIIIPASVKTIGNGAFRQSTLNSVIFEENSQLETIGYSAFEQGANLTEITIPASVRKIEEGAFGETTIGSVNFESGSNLYEIGKEVFYGSTLTEITIPSSVQIIGESAFERATLGSVTFESRSNLRTIDKKAFSQTTITEITIPSSVTAMAEFAFSSSTLDSITFESGSKLETIERYVFSGATLREIIIPASVTTIGERAFGSSNLDGITFESGSKLETIGRYAFYESTLTEIIIPASVTTIDDDAFERCTSLANVEFEAGSQLETIGEYAFSATSLETITIPSSVKTIKGHALTSLYSITFENNSQLQVIGDNAFVSVNLTEITLPANVVTIGSRIVSENVVVIIDYQTTYDALYLSSNCDVNKIKVLKTLTAKTANENYLNACYDKTESGDYYVYTKKQQG